MKIAIVGASGNVGQRLIAEAAIRGHQVTAIARNIDGQADDEGVSWVSADVENAASCATVLAGHDAVILSVPFKATNFDKAVETFKASDTPRLIIVGGAASLKLPDGQVLLDTEGFPDFIKPEAEPARQALNSLYDDADLNWTFLSPSMVFSAGERTGNFRLGGDVLLTAEDGQSHISYEDFSIAMLDEVETPRHARQRFTVGY